MNILVRRGLRTVASSGSHGRDIGAMKVAIAVIFLWIGRSSSLMADR